MRYCDIKMYPYQLIIILFTYYLQISDCAQILAYIPTPSISHQVVFRPLLKELTNRGHSVTVITTDPIYGKNKSPMNYTEIDIHKSYEIWNEQFVKYVQGKSSDALDTALTSFKILIDVIEKQFEEEDIQNILHNDVKYDLVIVEAFAKPAYVLAHLKKAPLIAMSSMPAFYPMKGIVGGPTHPIIYPEVIQHKIYNLSLIDKMVTLYSDLKSRISIACNEKLENDMLRKVFGLDAPNMSTLYNEVDMLFVNSNPVYEGNHAHPPTVVHIGGLHLKPEQPLPNDLKAYLDASKHGVIYMSFGTNVDPSLLPPEKIQIFNKVFSKLPYDVLWKWNTGDMPGKANNVKISKWLPQSDLLRHPKIKLFITQGGLQSTDESITAGVPLIAFPMLADQWYNAEKYVYHKIGLKMDFETLTEENLEASIKKIIEDDSYRQNVVHLRTKMNDQPQTPLERAVWWTEYVIRHKGAKHLKSPMANISWAEYLVLDVLLLVVGVGLVILLIGSYILYKIANFIRNFGVHKDKKKKQ